MIAAKSVLWPGQARRKWKRQRERDEFASIRARPGGSNDSAIAQQRTGVKHRVCWLWKQEIPSQSPHVAFHRYAAGSLRPIIEPGGEIGSGVPAIGEIPAGV